MSIYLVRHLSTEWNLRGVLQGTRDIPIIEPSLEERQTIQEHRHRLARVEFDAILSSSMKRARQTAEHYGFGAYVVDPGFDELDFGYFEGKPKSELIKWSGGLWEREPMELVLGESVKDFDSRLKAVIRRYEGYGNLLVFTHGAVIRGFCSILLGGDVNKMNTFTIGNNTVTEL